MRAYYVLLSATPILPAFAFVPRSGISLGNNVQLWKKHDKFTLRVESVDSSSEKFAKGFDMDDADDDIDPFQSEMDGDVFGQEGEQYDKEYFKTTPKKANWLNYDLRVPRKLLRDRFTTYGYFTRTAGNPAADIENGEIPANLLELAVENFKRELQALRRSVRFDEYDIIREQMAPAGLQRIPWAIANIVIPSLLKPIDLFFEEKGIWPKLTKSPELEWLSEDKEVLERVRKNRALLYKITLSSEAIWGREKKRRGSAEEKPSPLIYIPYLVICSMLDVLFEGRPIQRFWYLETVARMPYFAYLSVLHFYETLGWWRTGADLRKLHAAEEWNEMHHLLIMESLGGDQYWIDRFLAQHSAIVYYLALNVLYFISPVLSYEFSELLESHAVDTYTQFYEENEAILRNLPAPQVAREYYLGGDLYMFDAFQNPDKIMDRKPHCENLYDVFTNIAEDEGEHCKTMVACGGGKGALGISTMIEEQKKVLEDKY